MDTLLESIALSPRVQDAATARVLSAGALVYETPLTFYAQNMALLPWPLYKGIDASACVDRLIEILRQQQPDVVGLSEMWETAQRQRVITALADVYPYALEGPHEAAIHLGMMNIELLGGGLLLLSRHPILAVAQTRYRQGSGEDRLAQKGVLHARIQPAGHPCAVDVFLTHTQAPKPLVGGSPAKARAAIEAQIQHLAAFLRARRDPLAPAILMGDLNVDYFSQPDLYGYLLRSLGRPLDLALQAGADCRPGKRPSGTIESARQGICSFHPNHRPRPANDPARFGPAMSRLDYFLSFPGLRYAQHATDCSVQVEQWAPGRDISDHYAVRATIDKTIERLPVERERLPLQVRLRHIHCLKAGPGSHRRELTLTAHTARGETHSCTATVGGFSAGEGHDFTLQPLWLPDPGDRLTLVLAVHLPGPAAEVHVRRDFERAELSALVERADRLLAFPVLRTSGAECVVEIDLQPA